MPPVLALAPGVAIVVKAPPLSERWMVKPVSLVALSVKSIWTDVAVDSVAVRPVGAAGTAGMTTVAGPTQAELITGPASARTW